MSVVSIGVAIGIAFGLITLATTLKVCTNRCGIIIGFNYFLKPSLHSENIF